LKASPSSWRKGEDLEAFFLSLFLSLLLFPSRR